MNKEPYTHVHSVCMYNQLFLRKKSLIFLPFTSLFLIIPTNMILTKTKRKPTMFHVTINLTTLLTFPIQLSFIISLSTKLILFLSLFSSSSSIFHHNFYLTKTTSHSVFFASLSYIQILSPLFSTNPLFLSW